MSTTLATSSGTITIPDDIPWVDEFSWSPVMQQISITLGAAMIIESGNQLFGRPITLVGDVNTGWVSATVMDALRAAEAAQGTVPFALTLADGRTFSVIFVSGALPGGSGAGPAVTGKQIEKITPRSSDERNALQYFPVIRLVQVS